MVNKFMMIMRRFGSSDMISDTILQQWKVWSMVEEYSELEKIYGDNYPQKDKELNRERVRYTGNFMVDSIIFGITRDQKFKEVDFQFDGGLPSNLGC